MHMPRGRRHLLWENFVSLCFTLCLFSYFYLWFLELLLVSMLCCSHRIVFMCWTCIHSLCLVLYWLHVQMIICFAKWSLWSFPYDGHVFDQVAHMFHIMFTSSHFTCYIILVLLLLALPWGSNVFCASVSRNGHLCSKFITCFKFRCEWVLPLFPNSRLSLESVIGCFCHGISKGGNCKVVIYNYIFVGFIPWQKTL